MSHQISHLNESSKVEVAISPVASPKHWHRWIGWLHAAVCLLFGLGDDVVSVLASNIPLRKVRWLWPDRVPLGKLTLFAGYPGNGKSMATLYVAAITTTGRDWYDGKNPTPVCDVAIFAAEDDAGDMIAPRLEAAGANRARVHICNMQAKAQDESAGQRLMRLDKDISDIRRFLKDNPEIRVVILDPVSNYMGAKRMNYEQEVRDILTPLQAVAADFSIAIIAVMHFNKKEDARAINRVGGAMAFVGVARAVWIFDSDRETPNVFHMVSAKQNVGKSNSGLKYRISTKDVIIEGAPDAQPYIEWLGESPISADEIVESFSRKPGRPQDERDQAKALIESELAWGAVPAAQIENKARELNISPSTLQRAKRELGVRSVPNNGGWDWVLPVAN